jgi:hypothetical protein
MSARDTARAHSVVRLQPTPRWTKHSSYNYMVQARELLARHGLSVPDNTTEMIAKTIAKRYSLQSRPRKGEPSPRERLKKALTHAERLLEYAKRKIKDRRLRAAISTRSASLRRALDDLAVVIRLATATPLDVVQLLDRVTSGLSKGELTRLIRALKSALAASGKSGRPPEDATHVLRGACIAWLRAGRAEKYSWDEGSGTLKGPLAKFARDLLRCCRLEPPSDNALYCALRVALPECQASLRRIP